MKIKIYGAGSIGTHLAQASRRMGWDVTVVDPDKAALQRMKEKLYPSRYGAWDDGITLCALGDEPRSGFDMIFLGTPPDVRMKLALQALEEKPRILLLEKPLCTPSLEGISEFSQAYYVQTHTSAFMGYDHAVSPAFTQMRNMVAKGAVGEVVSIDVEFREHWKGIFAAHPWLSGPEDTYLGYARRGGGAGCEHSHALHLYLTLAGDCGFESSHVVGRLGRKVQGEADYDPVAAFTFPIGKEKVGRVIQDVVTFPVRKEVRVQGVNGSVQLLVNGSPKGDLLRLSLATGETEEWVHEKKRPDDFFREMQHLKDVYDGVASASTSPISYESGKKVMNILHEAYKASGFLP